MLIHFWGVRGSLATPLTPNQVQSKIAAAVQRITPEDIASPDARERFLYSLPEWLFGTTGGNTPCIELRGDDKTEIILDCGTGLRLLGNSRNFPSNQFHIILSHLHWDHISGLPFFSPAYNPNNKIDFYSPKPETEEVLRKQQQHPVFPPSATLDNFTKNLTFHVLEEKKQLEIGGIKINWCPMFHPGISYSYSFEENGKKFVYATDVEISQKDFEITPEHETVFRNADCIILDAQYTVEEAYNKENWGHSAFCYAIDFAVHWGIKKLYLFHHEPTYDDKKLNSILEAARWYAEYTVHSSLEVELAVEGKEFRL